MKILKLWRPTDPFQTAPVDRCHKLMIKQYKTHTNACIYIIHTASIISSLGVRYVTKSKSEQREREREKEHIYSTKIIYYSAIRVYCEVISAAKQTKPQ